MIPLYEYWLERDESIALGWSIDDDDDDKAMK